MIKIIFLAVTLFLTGCSSEAAAMMNFSNVYGNFIISAPIDFEYFEDGTYSNGIFLIGTEDGTESVMVLAMSKTDSEYFTVEGLAINYEEGLFYGSAGLNNKENEIIYEDYVIEGAVDALAKSFNATIENNEFLLYIAYIEFEDEYYIIQITSVSGGRNDDYYMDTLSSLERNKAFDTGTVGTERYNFDFEYSDNWVYMEGEAYDYLMSIDGKAIFIPFSMEEELDIVDIAEYMEIAKDIIAEIYGEYEIIHEEFKEVNGHEAGVVVYEYMEDGELLVSRQMCLINDNMVYVLTYTSDRDTYDLLLEELILMENSFQIF